MEVIRFGTKRPRRLKKGALAIMIGLLGAAVIAIAAIIFFGGAELTAQTGSIKTTVVYDAIIVRNETIVSTEEFDSAEYFAVDGQNVAAGEHIMDVYKMGYSREITLSLWRTKQEIYEAQLDVLGEARDVELRGYDNGIELAKRQLSEAVMDGNTLEVSAKQNELCELMSRRSEYLRGCIQETETLRSLYRKQDDWERAVSDAKISLYAEKSGRISYYLDDFALALNADKLSMITSDLVSSAIKRSKPAKWASSSKTSAYRIINADEWYCVFLTKATEPLRVTEGMRYRVKVEGYGEYEGVAQASFVSGSSVVNIIKIDEAPGELINVRAVRASVEFDATNIQVEKRAIQYDQDKAPYIEVVTGSGRVGVYVNILSSDGKYVIISAKNTENAPLAAGVKYWIPKRSLKGLL